MAQIKSISEIAAKWASVTPMRTQDYADGIQNPRRPWASSTIAASAAWADGVTKAIARRAFSNGVNRAGDEKWQRKASVEGVARWGPGVQGAEGDYSAGFAPYRDAIAAVVLPPRYARRDPRNMARVTAIVNALIARKESIEGRGGGRPVPPPR